MYRPANLVYHAAAAVAAAPVSTSILPPELSSVVVLAAEYFAEADGGQERHQYWCSALCNERKSQEALEWGLDAGAIAPDMLLECVPSGEICRYLAGQNHLRLLRRFCVGLGWDIGDATRIFTLMCIAGQFDGARWVAEKYRIVPDIYNIHAVAKSATLEVLEWFMSYMDNMDSVASVPVIRREHWIDAFYGACWQGNLPAARWLCANSKHSLVEIIIDALDGACEGGHLETARWMVAQFTGQFMGQRINQITTQFLVNLFEAACGHGHLEIAQWLDRIVNVQWDSLGRRSDNCLVGIALRPDFVRWICTSRPGAFAGEAGASTRGRLARYAAGSSPEAAKWMIERFGITLAEVREHRLMHGASRGGAEPDVRADLIEWMLARYPLEYADVVSNTNAYSALMCLGDAGRTEALQAAVVRWNLPCPGRWAYDPFVAASKSGHLATAKWLADQCSDLNSRSYNLWFVLRAIPPEYQDVIAWYGERFGLTVGI